MTSTVLAEYRSDRALLEAARQMRARGHADLDLHTPYPLHGAEEVLGLRRSPVPLICLAGGLGGALTGYLLQWLTVGVDFPINVGGRPPQSAPAFVPITFELGVLAAALFIFLGLMVLFGFPRLYHPVFEAEAFASAAVDGLWLAVAADPGQAERVAVELRSLGAVQVTVVSAGDGAEARAS
jgi:hypothetical protein